MIDASLVVFNAERFWSKVARTHERECWAWLGSFYGSGYGRFHMKPIDGTGLDGNWPQIASHRYAYTLCVGEIHQEVVRHTCDNRRCCNPSHLLTGSRGDNARDMVSRGRQNRWERHWNARLKRADVFAIREMAASGSRQREIAEKFGVSQTMVSNIVTEKAWRFE